MSRVLRHLLLPALCLSLIGCGLVSKAIHAHPKKGDKDNKAPKDLFIGVIDMVNPEQHFVLIKTGIQLKLQPGWKLETRPTSGQKSVLVITPEQKLNFLSADITEGFPQQGEMVVLPPQAGSENAVPTLPNDAKPAATPQRPTAPAAPFRAPNGEILPPPIP